jgi:nucleoside-diphosphate-sugar epimerase
LITGGAGFLGSRIARALVQRGDPVVIYDNLSTGLPHNLIDLQEKAKFVNGDILDLSFLIRTIKAEEVKQIIHTAALVGFAFSIEKPALTAKINIEGTLNILEASRIVAVERIMDISSEEVYGHFQYEPADEDHPYSPTAPYAITKVAAERFGQFYHRFFGLDVVTIRTSWVYGPGLPRARPPKIFIENSLKGIPTEMEAGAEHRADHTHIDDFVQGTLLAFDKKNLKSRIFNIASGKAYTFQEMARMVEEIIPGPKITVGPGLLKYYEGVEGPQKGALNIQRAQFELGFQPQYDLFRGLINYVESLRASEGIQPCQK